MSNEEKIVQFPQSDTVVTYTVAECGGIHSNGEYHKDIASIEEAKAIFEAIPEEKRSTISAIGINIHKLGTKATEDIQWDFLYGNTIDVNDLVFLPDIKNNQDAVAKLDRLIEAFPEAELRGGLLEQAEEIHHNSMSEREIAELDQTIDMDAVKPVYIDEAARIAAEIDRFSLDFDALEYKDTVHDWQMQVQNIADDIRNGNTMEYKRYLGEVLTQSDNIDDVRRSAELLIKLAEYKPLAKVEELEEENLNQIDNYLSNTVPKSEERKDFRNKDHERIEEEERKKRKRRRGRTSLKARLEEKKAIVEANKKVPQNVRQRKVQHEAIASQVSL